MRKFIPENISLQLIDHMNEAVWVGDEKERTIYANPKFCKLMGYTMEEMLGEESYIFWDKESAEKVRAVNNIDRKNGISSTYEGNLLTKNGKKIPVLISGTPLPNGGTVGIMTDLTELKKKEENEKVLSEAIKLASDAIIIFDNHGKILSWNKGAKMIFGYKEDEILNLRLSLIFPKEALEGMLSNNEVLYNFELDGVNKNGSKVSISATLTPIIDLNKKDKVNNYILVARDITGQKKFEEELNLKYRKMTEAYNLLGVARRQIDYVFELLEMWELSKDNRTIGDYIVSSIIMLTRVDACVLRTYNKEKSTLDLLSSFGIGNDWRGKSSIPYTNSLAQKSFMQEYPIKIIDLVKEPKYQSKSLAKKHNLSSLLLIPLKFNGQIVGSLSLYVTPEKKLEIFENEFIEKYAKLIQLIIANMVCAKD